MSNWVKGASGNPAGLARKRRRLVDLLREVGAETIPFPPGDDGAVTMTRREALARVLWTRALFDGDLATARVIIDYLDGKPGEASPAAPPRFTADDLALAEALLWKAMHGAATAQGSQVEPEGAPGSDEG